VLGGNVDSLASVYSVSFLAVMALFALGNMLLKYKRHSLKRSVKATWLTSIIACCAVLFALAGTLAKDTSILWTFAIYFSIISSLMAIMFNRVQTLRFTYAALHSIYMTLDIDPHHSELLLWLSQHIKSIQSQTVAFFTKTGKLSVLNKAVLYVRENEDCANIRIIHVYEDEREIPVKLVRNVALLDEEYPKVKIDLYMVKGIFSPEIITFLSNTLHIPKNLMFITSPTGDFAHPLASLGGVRLITH
jgi:hypothetical protein